jgi:short-subunit dehydrogenase
MVARRGDKLREIGKDLQLDYPHLKVWFFVADLTQHSHREALFEAIEDKSIFPDILINNAGMGDYGEFATADWPKIESIIQLNITALTHLTHALLPRLKQTQGGIINVSSLAALMPLAHFAVYAATKAYVNSFSEAIRAELRGHQVTVTAVCPGPISTEFGSVAKRSADEAEIPRHEALVISKQQVVAQALQALAKDRAKVYPGWQVALLAALVTVTPLLALRFFINQRPLKNRAEQTLAQIPADIEQELL